MEGVEANMSLPELCSGDILVDLKQQEWRVHRVRKPRRDKFDEPIYRLRRIVLGNKEWELQELSDAGLKLKED